MDKAETKQAPALPNPTPPEIDWRTIGQQALQGALLLGAVGIGIRLLASLQEDAQTERDPVERVGDEADDAVKNGLAARIAELEAEKRARAERKARFEALFYRDARDARALLGVGVFATAD